MTKEWDRGWEGALYNQDGVILLSNASGAYTRTPVILLSNASGAYTRTPVRPDTFVATILLQRSM